MPIVLDGTSGITTPMYNGSITANAVTPSVNMKNRIINGAMVISQRGTSSFTAADNLYTLDRWVCAVNPASKFTVIQSSDAPAGFNNSLLVTSSSAYTVGAAEYETIAQRIEGYNIADLGFGTASAKTITISFWVKSSLTGSFGAAITNLGETRCYPFSYTISAANTWEQKSVTIAGDTSGSWSTTTSTGINLYISLGTGSNLSGTANAWTSSTKVQPTGSVSVVGTNGATFYITGVQLEVGSTATSFDYRPYGTELALCQRYYVKYFSDGSKNQSFLTGVVISSTQANINSTNFANPMRATPTGSYSGLRIYDGTGVPAITSINNQESCTTTGSLNFVASGGGLTVGRVSLVIPNGVSCYVDFSAEL